MRALIFSIYFLVFTILLLLVARRATLMIAPPHIQDGLIAMQLGSFGISLILVLWGNDMQTEFWIIKPGSIVEKRSIELTERPTYAELCSFLNPIFRAQRPGALFERVCVLDANGEPKDMFVDELGADFNFPVNEIATGIYHRAPIKRGHVAGLNGIVDGVSKIHGIAVFFTRRVWF